MTEPYHYSTDDDEVVNGYEAVNHPKHYNLHPAGIECIDVIEHFGFNLGSAIKYCWRVGLKPGVTDFEDLEKAKWCIEREIQRLKRGRGVTSGVKR